MGITFQFSPDGCARGLITSHHYQNYMT